MSDTAKNCWTCDYQDNLGQDTFLGRCKYFMTIGKPIKDIPPATVDKGCKCWKMGAGITTNTADYEKEERIALVADGCNLTQKKAEILVEKMKAK